MNASAPQSKESVSSLVDVMSLAISHGRLDDAELVLVALRALRPRLQELDVFEAWIAMRRSYWRDAVRILRALEASGSIFTLAKALLAFCQFAMGDANWRGTADEVVDAGDSAEATDLMRLLIDPEGAVSGKAQEPVAAPQRTASRPPVEMPQGAAYLRG
jgi:type III secretion protein HrpB1